MGSMMMSSPSGAESSSKKWERGASAEELARVGDLAGDRRGGRRQRAGQERAAARALPAFEVAVAGADRVLARLDLVTVHGDAHRAPRLAPLRARLEEDAVEPLGLGLLLHALRSRH